MKSRNKLILKTTTILTVLLAFTFSMNLNAQGQGNVDGPITGTNNIPGNNGNNKPVGNAGPGDAIPLDGGLGILLAGAAFYGVKRLLRK